MTIRVQVPGGLRTGICGRVYVVYYPEPITIELAKQAQEDYVEFSKEFYDGEPTPLMMVVDKPFPLASMDTRVYWRNAAKEPPGFECIGLVIGGVVGLMAATVTHFGEQLVAVLGVRFRTFRDDYECCCWVCDNHNTETDPDALVEFVESLKALETVES